jgi:hypothetical protein
MAARLIGERLHVRGSVGPLGAWVDRAACVPIVGFAVIFPLWLRNVTLARTRRTSCDPSELDRRASYLKDLATRKSAKNENSVTPFQSPMAKSHKLWWCTDILKKWRDRRIDKFIEFNMFGTALELAEWRLQQARAVGDGRSMRVYQSYIDMLSPRVAKLDPDAVPRI